RFGTIDPRSEYTKEAYSYVWNNPINFVDPTGMEGEAASSDSGGGGETGEGGGNEGGPGKGDPPIKTQNIQEVVIVKPIQIKQGSSASFNFGGISNNPNSKQLIVAPAIAVYEIIALAISAIAAWDIADKAKDVELPNFSPPHKEEKENIREADIEEVVVPRPPKAVDDSGYKTPQDVLGGNRVDFARGKGERGFAGKTSGTDNPYKHVKPDTKKPGNVIYKHPQSGKKVSRPASPEEKTHFGIK
ncbi:MAG: hypothetical protein KUL76_04715, partial [Kaistella sp.]|nr:hypothetical protein [Kaistella sp.]